MFSLEDLRRVIGLEGDGEGRGRDRSYLKKI